MYTFPTLQKNPAKTHRRPDYYDDERDKILFHKTIPELQDQYRSVQDQDQDQDRFWSQTGHRSCPKTDGLRLHHWLIWQVLNAR